MSKRKTGGAPANKKNAPVPEMSLREHAAVVARELFADRKLRFESQLDGVLERLGLVRKSQV